ncbi:MAG TPA: hypothetical protein PKA20_08075 [Burkholderiaceae bacterium]|nr:hypothetical protein [Burkholderiaceae bacterium]
MGPLAGLKIVEFAGIGPGLMAAMPTAPAAPSGASASKGWLTGERLAGREQLLSNAKEPR